MHDYAAIWRAADKVVYSTTLKSVSSALTRIERDFDPDAVREIKASAGGDISVGGPDLAATAWCMCTTAARTRTSRLDYSRPTIARKSSVEFACGNGASGTASESAAQIGSQPSPGCQSTSRAGGTAARTCSL